MTRNIIFDFGAVLVDWNPHYVFDNYFGDRDKADRFLSEICNMEWNSQMDAGKPFDQGVAELSAVHPEWKKEIELYRDRWTDMMGDAVPGMYDLVKSLKDRGLKIYGLTNWSAETFPLISGRYPIFSLLEGYVVSGVEKCMKPQEKIYRILLERYGLKAEESIFIDDNPANIEGGKAVGIDGIVFQTVEQLKEELERKLKIESGK